MSDATLTTDDQTQPKLRMNAYYYAFSETGVRCIDEILSAVATAGKAYHHTDEWLEAGYIDKIQHAAGRAAMLINAAPDLLAALKRRNAMDRGNADFHEPGCRCVVHEADAAIAKAEGRS